MCMLRNLYQHKHQQIWSGDRPRNPNQGESLKEPNAELIPTSEQCEQILSELITPEECEQIARRLTAANRASVKVQYDKRTVQRNMATFRRMLKDVILRQGDAENALDWIGPLYDVTPTSSPLWAPVCAAFAAVQFLDYGLDNPVSQIASLEARQLARIFRKEFVKVDAA